MTEMIERVARAIYASEGNRVKPAGGEWRATTLDDEDQEYRDLYYEYARAAIEAMREPTVEMQRVVSANWGRRTWSEYNDVIDAALKENS